MMITTEIKSTFDELRQLIAGLQTQIDELKQRIPAPPPPDPEKIAAEAAEAERLRLKDADAIKISQRFMGVGFNRA